MSDLKVKKGFVQVNITGFIFHPASELNKHDAEAMGDFVEAQPIMYDLYELPAHSDLDTKEKLVMALRELPPGLLQEVHSLLEEMVKIVRLHRPTPTKLIPVGVRDQSIQEAPKPKLFDATGGELKPTKH